MSDCTSHGSSSATKITKLTKITNNYLVFVLFVFFVIFVPESGPWPVSLTAQQPAAPTEAQQRPVFRGGAHFVRVDAYPAEHGKIVEGLKPEDFEILEDGKKQAIESFDFIRFEPWTPEAERRDPVSQRAGFDLAADPRYRVFVIFADTTFNSSAGPFAGTNDLSGLQGPLADFIERTVGPRDLFGFLTPRNSVKDLVLGQKTTATVAAVKDLLRTSFVERDDADEALDSCVCPMEISGPKCDSLIQALKWRFRADATYTGLTNLIVQLGSLRQERKNIVLATNLLPRWREDQSLLIERGAQVPKTGVVNGRITTDTRAADILTNAGNASTCATDFQRLALMDFEPRYWQLFADARRENVSFYVITSGGLKTPISGGGLRGAAGKAYSDLEALSANTDGVAVTEANDLDVGLRRIADDLSAYYLLGYYSTNTKFDGQLRTIKVRLKATGQTIRARREYRAPTRQEVAAMARPAAPPPAADSGPPAADSGPPAVIGPPIAYRVSRTQPIEKVTLLEFVRADRLRVEWPVLAPLDRREARVLDSAGKALPIDLPVSEAPERKTVVVELPLAPFSRGVYAIELIAGAGGKIEQRRLTFMMK